MGQRSGCILPQSGLASALQAASYARPTTHTRIVRGVVTPSHARSRRNRANAITRASPCFPFARCFWNVAKVRNSYNSPSVLEGRVRQSIARSARPLVVEAEGRAEAPDAVARLAVEGVDFHEHDCAGGRRVGTRVQARHAIAQTVKRWSFDDSRDADRICSRWYSNRLIP